MEITATELKLNLGKYLEASNDEVVTITKNGKVIARLIGVRSYKYDFSELEEFDARIKSGLVLGEASVPGYGEKHDAVDSDSHTDSWLLTRNGEPVAKLTPVVKENPKRRLGFMHGPPDSSETFAALLEPVMTDEEYRKWLNKDI
jgi:prevent-host-death family protein